MTWTRLTLTLTSTLYSIIHLMMVRIDGVRISNSTCPAACPFLSSPNKRCSHSCSYSCCAHSPKQAFNLPIALFSMCSGCLPACSHARVRFLCMTECVAA
jgi:hypothetical protein|eukprot:COSAG06_NODE_147_length_22091_cov_70.669880_7_plen_100_part_00